MIKLVFVLFLISINVFSAEDKDDIVKINDVIYVSDVGILQKNTTNQDIDVKYVLKDNGKILRFIIEPSDVDLSVFVGRTISISGYLKGKTKISGIPVMVMRNASTFG